jgi:phytoene dehydrogenase-like protein
MLPKMNRRHAIKLLTGTGIALYLSPKLEFSALAAGTTAISEISPINRGLGELAPRIWFADYPEKAHKVLWDKAGYIASLGKNIPQPKERVPLVVIGGGIAGLFSAYILRQHKPIILEQAPRFGGNSKGQSWHGVDYSIGAAYFIEPEADSEIDVILKELGVDKLWKLKSEEGPVAVNNKIFTDFWSGESAGGDAHAKAQFVKLAEYFRKVNEGEEITYPDIPITDPEIVEYINELDRETFKAHLERIIGEPLVPQIEAAIEHYCWSSLGASSTEISAASGLNFYAAEFGSIAVLPGGNSAVAERVLERLASELPATNLRPDCLVYDVTTVADGVVVSYQDGGGNAHAIHAKAVVMACPKFVVNRVLTDIEPERKAAIQKLKYRSYLVANICIKGGGKAPFYDLYLLGEGTTKASDPRTSSDKQKVTDVIYANYAKGVAGSTVLTLYRGLPYDSARVEVLAPDSYQRYRAEFEAQLKNSILPMLKIAPDAIVDMRIARWGHPLPVAAVGLIADGVAETLRKPFKDRIFFIEQDNWALPAFETSLTEAQLWAPQVDNVLNGKPIETVAVEAVKEEVETPAEEAPIETPAGTGTPTPVETQQPA